MSPSPPRSDRRGVRHRGKPKDAPEFLPSHRGDDKGRQKFGLPTPTFHLICFLVGLAVVFGIIVYVEKQLPTPLMVEDEANNPGRFIAERAKNTLVNLTNIGPRVTGSYENEVLAVNFLKNAISLTMQSAKPIHKIEVDFQKISGSFPLTFLDGMTHVYHDVQNVIVKIGSLKGSDHSILMNCHFDTVSDSPGGSDDGASCVLMLEILRLLSQADKPLVHNLVLLFNGAEENFMQASHGFITKHKWAKEIRAVVNLESCGAGGREVMFQSGPNHPWLMRIYSENVGYPFASSLAQEIFQSGFIPGDTDYRIFRDFGGVPGLDFAWYLNGYVYHTKNDNAAHVPLGSLQRTGDNMVALVSGLLSAEELSNTSKHKEGRIVFFDFLGAFIMFWSLHAGDFLNVITLALSMYSMMSNMKEAINRGLSQKQYLKQLLSCAGTALQSWLLSLFVAVALALSLTALGRTMSWYARPIWIIFLYVLPSLIFPMILLLYKAQKQRKVVVSPWTLFQLYYDSYQLVWSIMLLLSTLFRVQSGFIPLFWVIFPTIGNLIRIKVFQHWRDWKWLLLHATMMFLPFVQCAYMTLNAVQLFIPIMGRTGAANNGELILAVLCTVMFCLLFSYIIPIILLVRNPKQVLTLLISIFVGSILALIFTPLGFPYSGDPASLAQQRFAILHAERSFHDIKGDLINRETGFWIVDLDINSPHTVRGIVPEMDRIQPVTTDCDKYLYCGMPYFIPILSFIWKTHWVEAPPISVPINTTFNILSREKLSQSVQRLTFNVTGPDHMGLMISPVKEAELLRWSILEEPPLAGPKWKGRETYFVYFSYADKPKAWVFSLDLRVPEGWNEAVVDIALTSHFVHGPHQQSQPFKDLVRQFPAWTTVTGWQSTYKSFIY
ncbi:hypothetical protein FOCC_FOCC015360 [Frankliniella occidentalis]|uniref:FXNA-like protease n=1 Tax=Frankliniella occidentalis TaxID=133901 RepID=A0A6J1TFN9_FRAOC|nr:endoplasmic reticulum metallopeptidase 1 isoform X1 [Frankliniella occidentalis]KAE8739131.1 hypothetical protein FOCC_FOCC015360 [Frankliniella occidentalis]